MNQLNGFRHPKNADHRPWVLAECPPLLSGILPADYTRLLAAARVKEFTRGQVLYIKSDPVREVILLTTGLVKITQTGMDGAEVILRLSVPGDVLGVVGLFSSGRHGTTAQAFRLCRTLVWDAPVFKGMAERLPSLHGNMLRILGEYLEDLEERFREVSTERVAPRVARQLARLVESIGRPADGEVQVSLSRELLAQMTGTTLFTVSRLLSAWEARGIVRPCREAVTICDFPSLCAIAEGR